MPVFLELLSGTASKGHSFFQTPTDFQLWSHPGRALILLGVFIELDTKLETEVLEFLLGEPVTPPPVSFSSDDRQWSNPRQIADLLLTQSLIEGVFVDGNGRHGGDGRFDQFMASD